MALGGLLEEASVLDKHSCIEFGEQGVQPLVSGLSDEIVLFFCDKSCSRIYKQPIDEHPRLAYRAFDQRPEGSELQNSSPITESLGLMLGVPLIIFINNSFKIQGSFIPVEGSTSEDRRFGGEGINVLIELASQSVLAATARPRGWGRFSHHSRSSWRRFFTDTVASLEIGAAKVHRRNTSGPKPMKTSVNRVRARSLTLRRAFERFPKDVAFSRSTSRHDLNASF